MAEGIFMKHAFSDAFVLLAKAVPERYSAPTFGKILRLSADLERHPYRRLRGVLHTAQRIQGQFSRRPRRSTLTWLPAR